MQHKRKGVSLKEGSKEGFEEGITRRLRLLSSFVVRRKELKGGRERRRVRTCQDEDFSCINAAKKTD